MDKPIILCDRCDHWASCLLDYDGEVCRKHRTAEPSRADRVRSLSDEDLALLFHGVQIGAIAMDEPDANAWLRWLQEETAL